MDKLRKVCIKRRLSPVGGRSLRLGDCFAKRRRLPRLQPQLSRQFFFGATLVLVGVADFAGAALTGFGLLGGAASAPAFPVGICVLVRA